MELKIKTTLLLLASLFMSLLSASAQTKIDAESYTKCVTSDEITTVNDGQAIGDFDVPGEQLIYNVNVQETGFYQFSFKYITGRDGLLRIQTDDGSYFVYSLDAYRLLGDDWDQLPINDWYEFPIVNGPSFYMTAGEHTITVTNEDAVMNIDYFLMQESDVTDKTVAFVKTVPSKVNLTPYGETAIYPISYNASGEMIAVPVTWSSNAVNGIYKAGNSETTDVVTVTVGGVSKEVGVSVEKPEKKREFVVSRHGNLNTSKGYVCDASRNKVCLMGTSFYWSCSAPLWWCKETVDYLVDQYSVQIIRLPVAIAPCGINGQDRPGNPLETWNKDCYYYRPEYTKKMVDEVVKAAIENDIYVIIDFHEHYAEEWVNLAQEFFSYFAKKWGEYPNVMYEIYNEPMCDNGTVIQYAKQIIPAIRFNDPDNIIIVGSSQYAREPDEVTAAGQGQTNIAYSWHGYVPYGHQNDWSSDNSLIWNTSIPVIATEWGLANNKNDGGLFDIFKSRGVINCFWSMSNIGGDDAKWSVLKSECYKKSGWTDEDMTENGAYMLEQTRGWLTYKPTTSWDDASELSMSICSDKGFSLQEKETTLSGSAKGGTGNYSYTWIQLKGPNTAIIASPNSAETKVSGLANGVYTFMLSVNDGEDELFEIVSVYPKGDADGDGEVTAADIVAMTNYIIGNTPAGFSKANADVNLDGVINIADIVAVSNILLND